MAKEIRGILRKKMKDAERFYPPLLIREPKQIISLPSFKDVRKINFKYPLLEPLVYANIKWVPAERKLMYNIIEPELTPKQKETLKKMENNLTEMIDVKISVIKK